MTACDTFVGNVEGPKDSAPSEQLNTPQDVRFLATGVQTQGANATGFLTRTADLQSDQFRFGLNSDATFPTFAEPDRGVPSLANTSVGDAERALGEYRRLADDLLDAADRPSEYPSDGPITEQRARYIGQLHGAIARYYYATYMGRNPREGGGVIGEGPFIPAPAMYDSARVKFNKALNLAPTSAEEKIVRSLHARSALYAGTQYGANTSGYSDALQRAADLASGGLVPGDASFNAQYSVQSVNLWWSQAGPGRFQFVAMDDQLDGLVQGSHKPLSTIRSFKDVLASNSQEANRIPVDTISLGGGATELGQVKYPVRESPTPYITWEEMHLIRAELELRGYDASSQTPLALVNKVRADGTNPGQSSGFGLAPLGSVDLEQVAEERDRTLFAQGQRLPDQRRLAAVDWHLVESFQGQTTWQFLPIGSQERDNNPDF
jgi:hypothetical protein